MKPGLLYKLTKAVGATFWDRMNFLSLMLALFLGTSALPHILIRYYTVPSQRAARKSTIVAISAIGFFYVLTLYMGLGSMINGALDVESSNMSAPLLAKTFGVGIFSIISAIAFATVLGTVSGLIVASSGAIAHDFIDKYLQVKMTDKAKVKAGKLAAVGVGIFAIILGILFKGMNVSFLVGLAFAVAASANLPAILFLLFWKKTTAKGIAWSIIVGIVSSIGIILFSPTMYEKYGLIPKDAPIPLDNPGIISIPLAVITLVVISLLTQKDNSTKDFSK
jgi:cation/acetate symporter